MAWPLARHELEELLLVGRRAGWQMMARDDAAEFLAACGERHAPLSLGPRLLEVGDSRVTARGVDASSGDTLS